MTPGTPYDPVLESTGAACFVRAGDADWASVVTRARARHESVAIGVDRRGPRTVLRMARGATLSPRRARRALRSMGVCVVATYAVWPSLSQPRLVYESLVLGWWLQRAGVVGGGGGSSVKQRFARSVLASPLLAAAHPSEIWIVNP